MKINSTIICYALIVLIVGYLLYINRNDIMGITSKFGAPQYKKVFVYNYIPKQNITVTSGEDNNYTSNNVVKDIPTSKSPYDVVSTNTPYGLNMSTQHPTPTRADPKKTQLRYFRINYDFKNNDYVYFGYYNNQYMYFVINAGIVVRNWTPIYNL